MSDVQDHLRLLGYRVRDRVTGFTGVITSISFDLYGCIQAVVNPGLDKDGKPQDQHWFDVNRLQLAEGPPVMPSPVFESVQVAKGEKGPAEKPRMTKV